MRCDFHLLPDLIPVNIGTCDERFLIALLLLAGLAWLRSGGFAPALRLGDFWRGTIPSTGRRVAIDLLLLAGELLGLVGVAQSDAAWVAAGVAARLMRGRLDGREGEFRQRNAERLDHREREVDQRLDVNPAMQHLLADRPIARFLAVPLAPPLRALVDGGWTAPSSTMLPSGLVRTMPRPFVDAALTVHSSNALEVHAPDEETSQWALARALSLVLNLFSAADEEVLERLPAAVVSVDTVKATARVEFVPVGAAPRADSRETPVAVITAAAARRAMATPETAESDSAQASFERRLLHQHVGLVVVMTAGMLLALVWVVWTALTPAG